MVSPRPAQVPAVCRRRGREYGPASVEEALPDRTAPSDRGSAPGPPNPRLHCSWRPAPDRSVESPLQVVGSTRATGELSRGCLRRPKTEAIKASAGVPTRHAGERAPRLWPRDFPVLWRPAPGHGHSLTLAALFEAAAPQSSSALAFHPDGPGEQPVSDRSRAR